MEYRRDHKIKKAIAFDFLGVIVKHDGKSFVSEDTYAEGEPNFDVIEAMHILKEKGFKIVVSSTVANEVVKAFCLKYAIPIDEINDNSDFITGNKGKPVASVYVDDRALQYSGQNSIELAKQIINFKPYWKDANKE